MTATNHALSGAVIGAFLPLPIALPLAFISHFVLDALPHFSVDKSAKNHHSIYKNSLILDSALSIILLILMVAYQKWAMLICGFTAYSPDLGHLYYYFANGRDLQIKAGNRFTKFHIKIQWYEKPKGLISELIALAILLPIFIDQL